MVIGTDASEPRKRRWPGRSGVSARFRILLWCALLVALALASSVVATRFILLRQLRSETDRELVHEVREVDQLRTAGVDPVSKAPLVQTDDLLQVALSSSVPRRSEELVAIVDGAVVGTRPPHPILRLERNQALVASWSSVATSTFGTITTPAGTVRYLAVPVALSTDPTPGKDVFVAAAFLAPEQANVNHTVGTAAVVGLASLGVAILLAWLIAGRILAPVRDLEVATRTVSDVDLTHRLEVKSDDELGRLARAFNAMLDRVESAFRSQRQFLDDAGHELRTPITVIRGHLELLGDDAGEREEVRGIILDELDRMGRMVNDLLLLARAERPDFLHGAAVDTAQLTAELQAKASALADRTWLSGGRADGTVVADRQRLTQAWMQLAQNATQNTGPGDPIEIGSRFRHDCLELWVEDSGPGVPEDRRQAIFRDFARSSGTPRDGEHFGLGLPIVRAITEAHGGTVTVEDGRLGGALFTMHLPTGDPRQADQ